MQTVWKFLLQPGHTWIEMPAGAQILRAGWQDHAAAPSLWALVNTEQRKEPRQFFFYQTGDEIPKRKDLQYIDTVLMARGALVFHLFELVPVEDL